MEILIITLAVSVGCLLGYLAARLTTVHQLSSMALQKNIAENRNAEQVQYRQQLESTIREKEKAIHLLIADLSRSDSAVEHLTQKIAMQQSEAEAAQQRLTVAFRNLANEILEEKSARFTEQNKSNLHDLLLPLGEKIRNFEKKVEETYDRELREKVSLKTEIRGLFELNRQLSEEAGNLAKALKGDQKLKGNWGELILERILEQSGLDKGRDYTMQHATKNADGRAIQPDAVIFLPDGRHLIIDAKVSLTAYEQAMHATDEAARSHYVRQHVLSVKNHIRLLSEKNYHTAEGLQVPDFVFLFLWSEAAFSAAVQADAAIFQYAWERNIAIVSPTTVWANLKTVAGMWKQAYQNRNAEEIARQGAALYEKLVGFVEDMLMTGKKLEEARKYHDDAVHKLHSGSGNLIRRAEKMKTLGLKPAKNLPAQMIQSADA